MKARISFSYLIAWALLTSSLTAQPAANTSQARVHAEAYPESVLEIPAGELTFQPSSDTIRFNIREIGGSGEEGKETIYPAQIKSVQVPVVSSKPSEKTRLFAVVIDATKSVPEKQFQESIAAAKKLIEDMPDGAGMAVFRINGKPSRLIDFTSNKKELLSTLKKIKRTGKVTRIYDSLFFALKETSARAKKRDLSAGGLVVFTDGRDEGSYLTEEDCLEIAAKGQNLQIPIYVVLNGSTKNERLLKRMALRSGGELFHRSIRFEDLMKNEEEDQTAAGSSNSSDDKLVIRYTSLMPFWKAWPGSTIHVKAFYDNQFIGSASYQVPGLYAFLAAHPALFLLFFAVLSGVLASIVWLFLSVRRKEQDAKETEDKLNIPDAYSDIFIDLRDPRNNPPVEQGRIIESEASLDESDDPSSISGRRRFEQEAMTLNLKEKAYVVLQMALKEAPSYDLGVLIKKQRDLNRLDQRYDLFLEETYIGSSPSATLPVKDHALAGLHVKIKRFDKKYIIFDLGGRAGTFLNGKKILRPMPLRSGDEIRMGHTMFIFKGERG
jgi:hypothetical protein